VEHFVVGALGVSHGLHFPAQSAQVNGLQQVAALQPPGRHALSVTVKPMLQLWKSALQLIGSQHTALEQEFAGHTSVKRTFSPDLQGPSKS
jgi:hypothetical protein